jgi:hypothetical protein
MMSNVYEQLNPYKPIVFVTQQADGKAPWVAAELKEYTGALTLIQMDTVAAVPNGKLPQEAAWLAKCLEKSQMAANNHIVIVKNDQPGSDQKYGPIVEEARKQGMKIVTADTAQIEEILVSCQGPQFR